MNEEDSIDLQSIINEWIIENHTRIDLLEERYFHRINEIKIDSLNSYSYEKIKLNDTFDLAWKFEDRCGNTIIAAYYKTIGEFKTGFKVENEDTLIFDPKKLPKEKLSLIVPCTDEKRVNTVYKILIEEVIPKYLLSKKPNKLYFNPVSDSRKRLVDIIMTKIIEKYPQLTKKNNYLIYI
jgi:hypothetical protein